MLAGQRDLPEVSLAILSPVEIFSGEWPLHRRNRSCIWSIERWRCSARKNVTLKSKLSLRNQKKAMGKPLTAVNAQIKNERALLSILGCKALMPNEELFYDFILEYVVYTVLPVIYNRGRI